MRISATILLLLALAGCNAQSANSGPPGTPSKTDVNPITGARGGTNGGGGH